MILLSKVRYMKNGNMEQIVKLGVSMFREEGNLLLPIVSGHSATVG